MRRDEFDFLELFGNIDEEYIYQALKPWEGQTGRYVIYNIGRKVACLAIIVILGFCLAFHDQVYAAISRFTTMIAEILQLSNDLTPYTDIINTTQEKDGISTTLNEVILSDNSLFASVSLYDTNGYDEIGVSAGESIKINGTEWECDSSRIYQSQSLEDNNDQYVVEWIYDVGVPLEKKADIEIEIVIHKQIEDIDGVPFVFAFSASKEELQKNTVRLKPDQRIRIDGKEAVIREVAINSVTSSIELECNELPLEKNQYYLGIKDMQGEEIFYSLVRREGNLFTFQDNGEIPSVDNEWLEGQIYALPYHVENQDAIDPGLFEGEVSEIFRVDNTEMVPVGETFRIVLKE